VLWAVPVLICDVGSVLLRTSLDSAVEYWHRRDGCPPGLRDATQLSDDALRDFRTGRLSESDYVQYLRSRWGWATEDGTLRKGWDESVAAVHLDVLELLRELRERGWFLVGTACLDPWQEQRCHALLHGPNTVFHRVTTSVRTGALLPDPRFFAAALRGIPSPGARLYTDDRPEHVAGARRAGLTGHLFRDCSGLRTACRSLLTVAL
jgi:FMN phosphatase YigB (HAD superfamily)